LVDQLQACGGFLEHVWIHRTEDKLFMVLSEVKRALHGIRVNIVMIVTHVGV